MNETLNKLISKGYIVTIEKTTTGILASIAIDNGGSYSITAESTEQALVMLEQLEGML